MESEKSPRSFWFWITIFNVLAALPLLIIIPLMTNASEYTYHLQRAMRWNELSREIYGEARYTDGLKRSNPKLSQDAVVPSDAVVRYSPATYIVQSGDEMWMLSYLAYGSPKRAMDLLKWNEHLIGINDLEVGQTVFLPPLHEKVKYDLRLRKLALMRKVRQNLKPGPLWPVGSNDPTDQQMSSAPMLTPMDWSLLFEDKLEGESAGLRWAEYYQKKGEAKKADSIYQILMQVNPESLSIKYFYGNFLVSNGRSLEATRYFKTVVEKDPNHLAAQMSLAAIKSDSSVATRVPASESKQEPKPGGKAESKSLELVDPSLDSSP